VRVHARDRFNHVLERLAHTSGRATLVVTPAPAPATPAPIAPPTVGSVLPGGIFPVAGAHAYGDGVGAARNGHTHQGQDVTAAEGTPVVAPVAGTVTITSYQAGAAGYYVVEQANDGRSFFFAHCQKGSFGSEAGTVIAAGAPICSVGHTGDATGPHLHFEEWLGGWRVDSESRFVDPLPQLKAWDR
jgi:murein DD-endopeptidase MepM/ murein hydrolase activator NlpD